MLTVSCPNCGADVVFRSPALPVKVCDYCQTNVMRVGDELRDMGKAAVLPFDISPIRIGTSGRFDGQGFDVIGRVRWGWSDGSWNEWLMLFGDGSHGWLGEAMGQFMVTRERALDGVRTEMFRHLASGGDIQVGESGELDGVEYIAADIKQATCLAAEGELPFTAPAGWTIDSIDFRTTTGAVASFQRDGEEANLYLGRYVELGELKPQDLREITGWAMPRFAA